MSTKNPLTDILPLGLEGSLASLGVLSLAQVLPNLGSLPTKGSRKKNYFLNGSAPSPSA